MYNEIPFAFLRGIHIFGQDEHVAIIHQNLRLFFNPLALELDIYSLAHHLCKM